MIDMEKMKIYLLIPIVNLLIFKKLIGGKDALAADLLGARSFHRFSQLLLKRGVQLL